MPKLPRLPRRLLSTLRVLALESSADDACAAIVTSRREILSNVVCKQHDLNKRYGGIHPIKSQDAHARDMPGSIALALRQAEMRIQDVDAIAYTRGPGMYGCLSVAAHSARALAAAVDKPILGIHHMQAHALTPLLTETTPPHFPFLTLLVSGGHTLLVLVESLNSFKILMTTLDNSIGDAFDKTARLLRLPHSPTLGLGPILETYASLPPLPPFDNLPLPPLRLPLSANTSSKTLAFSFAGLLTAAERLLKSVHPNLELVPDEAVQRELSRVFQQAAVGHVVKKIRDCLQGVHGVGTMGGLVVSGGVACNLYLREQLETMLTELDSQRPMPLFYPPLDLCTDNAAMIAWTAILRLQDGHPGDSYDLPLRPKWSLEALYDDIS